MIHLTTIFVVATVWMPTGAELSSALSLLATVEDEFVELVELDNMLTIAAPREPVPQDVDWNPIVPDPELAIVHPAILGAVADGQTDSERSAAPISSPSHGGDDHPWRGLVIVRSDRPSLSRTDARGDDGSQTAFFGMTAYGRRFVYILDISTSMKRPSNGVTRFQTAADQLLRSISLLEPDQHFTVIVFCGATRQMFDKPLGVAPLVRATDENRRRLAYWLDTVTLGPYTDPRRALKTGLELRPDAIFLLSDGEFNKAPAVRV